MRHASLLTVALVLCGFLGQVAPADATAAVLSTPGLLTSSGQASDVVVVKALLNTKLKLAIFNFDNFIENLLECFPTV